MLGVEDRMPDFRVTGVRPKVTNPLDDPFVPVTQDSFEDKWKVFFFYPRDFTFVCPTEILEFARLNKEFLERNCVVLGGSTDNEYCKLAWRRDHPDLNELDLWMFADTNGSLVDGLGIRHPEEGVALRATYIVDPFNIIQHADVNNLLVGRNPTETLRILDALQTGENCGCNREIGGETL
jgi:peroxiredoxin (alkyl hydroperoxide reductase subunit C)